MTFKVLKSIVAFKFMGPYDDWCHQSLHSIQRVADTSITLAKLGGAGAMGVIILKTTLFCHFFFFLFICLNRLVLIFKLTVLKKLHVTPYS